MINSLRGFRDILPPDSELFAQIETVARDIFSLHGYREVRLPTLESKELFIKSTGETTDIVEKEMYAFTDGGNREVAMRPEGTPGVVRAYIEHNLSQTGRNAKYFYIGSMFRAERPQAGRYREFEQIGAESIGSIGPYADAESIIMLLRILERAGASNCRAEINSLGCAPCRKAYRETLLSYLKANSETLCEPCRKRIDRNPLRALDCKTDAGRLAEQAPKIALCADCADHFSTVQDLLSQSGAAYRVNTSLVRGLDYYTRTVFEIKSSALGAQDAVAAGGRYDELVKSMGGPVAPAVGWAMGVDRLALVLKETALKEKLPQAFVICACDAAGRQAFALLTALRSAGVRSDFSDFGLSLKSQMRSAGKSGAPFTLIIGEDELNSGSCAIKHMKEDGSQLTIPAAEAAAKIKELLSAG